MSERKIRFSTDIITFFNTEYWGLPADLPYEEWTRTVYADPKPYFDRMLDGAVECGLDGIELAPEPGGWEGALRAYGTIEGVKEAMRSRGLALSTSYANGGALIGNALADPEKEAEADAYMDAHARFVRELGGDRIVMGTVQREPLTGSFDGPVPDEVFERVAAQIDRLARVTAAHGVTIALHTDAYSVCSRTDDVTTVLELTDPRHVFLCLDAGHTTLDGGDAVEVLRRHVDRTPVMHWKDCIEPLDGSTLEGDDWARHDIMLRNFRILGSGLVDWKAWQRILRDADWEGWAVAEIDMSPDPVGEIRAALDYFHRELAGIHR